MKILQGVMAAAILSSCAAAQAEPYTAYRMIKDILDDDAPHQEIFDLEIRFDKVSDMDRRILLYAKVSNNFKQAICIPSVFYARGYLNPISPVLNVQRADGSSMETKMFPFNVYWPATSYVVLPPSSEDTQIITLTDYYDFDEIMRPFSVSFSFPAFFCNALEKGYPVTARMLDQPYSGLVKGAPVTVINPEDVIVFRAHASAPNN